MFEDFALVSLWRLSTSGELPNLTPGACMAQFSKGNISHCLIPYIKAVGLAVPEKKNFFFSFSYCKSMGALLSWKPQF